MKKRGIVHVILDYHDEYLDFADEVIDVRKGLTINPLEVVEQGPIDTAYLIPAILRRLGLVGGDQQEAYLRKAILRAYGIDVERGMKPVVNLGRSKIFTFKDVRRSLRYFESSNPHASKIILGLMNCMGILFDLELFIKETFILFREIVRQTTVISLKSLPTDETRLAVGDFFLRKLWNFVYKWGESRNLRLFCVADEAHRLAYPKSPIDSILREARKYGVGMILASQSLHDFDPIVFGNVATKMCFRCPLEGDAQFMAKQMGC